MNVAVLSCHTPSIIRFRMDMIFAFQDKGHTVVVIGDQPESMWHDYFWKYRIKYRQVQVIRNTTNPLTDIKSLVSIYKVLKEELPDKLFVYQAKTIVYGGIAASLLGITEVYPLIAGAGSIFLASSIKGRIVKRILCAEYRFGMKKCPVIFFQNQDDVSTFRENHILRNQRVHILNGSGVDIERFAKQPLPNRFGILCVARLIRDKGIMEYLEACRRLKIIKPEIKCMLVGPYDTNPTAIKKEELQPFIDENIIEYYGEQQDVRPFLAQTSVYVLPSYREGTPKSVLEAMACGKAIVTTDAPGCRETVQDGVNGFLVPIKNAASVAERVYQLYMDSDLLKKMAENSCEIAMERFDVKKVNDSIIETMKL